MALGVQATLRTQANLTAMISHEIGGDFWAPPYRRTRFGPQDGLVVLRPQSIAELRQLLQGALQETEAGRIVVSAPQAAWARRARKAMADNGVTYLVGACDPWSLLPRTQALHASGDDPWALLALLLGRRVHCTAAGDVAGWGLTCDADSIPTRASLTLLQLAHAALLSGVLYYNPFDGNGIVCEEAVEILADWRRITRRNRSIACCVGMAWWKRGAIGELLTDGETPPPCLSGTRSAVRRAQISQGSIAVWASREPHRLGARAARHGTPVLSVEDGFIRSAGLGSVFVEPCSIVVDQLAPHYDPRRPSELELMLSTAEFPPALLARANHLIDAIVAAGISKYNVGAAVPPPFPADTRTILVPGQVEDDQSVRLAGAGLDKMIEFLARVRALEPRAFIVYKPHPDVEAGLRPGAIPDRAALQHVDLVVRGVGMPALLDRVQAVHTLTSLSGFEAVLRKRDVVVHGQPFYAGWGLTHDLAPIARRRRRLTRTELAAAALILYPLYRDPLTGLPSSPEVVLGRLKTATSAPTALLPRLRQWQGRVSRALTQGF